MRQPRLAEMIAGQLRQRILDGDLPDGGSLPSLDKLVQEFQVSPPPVREALRILEHERLITVRRGAVGGAVVHRPRADAVGYVLGLVLESERVRTADLRAALAELQPVCAAMCARRADRGRVVVPRLVDACDRMAETIDDPRVMEPWSRQFHGELIAGCGNDTLVLVVGALEQLWSSQDEAWTHRVAVADESPDIDLRRQGLRAHLDITAAIEEGDAEAADRLVRDHMHDPRIFTARTRGPVIRATP
ncbi:MAG: GntR domain protein [Acidimicrobiales bacterium]|nr:GntR domain protein [Acidimicrobiales bacterium]